MRKPQTTTPVVREEYGLVAWLEANRVRLPLKGIECQFVIHGGVAEVRLDQIFEQNNPQPLDCRYLFPLPGDAAVFRCEAVLNGRVIAARIEERERAVELAREHQARGERTALVECERDNLFTLSLGNVQPGDLVVVRLAYVQSLSPDADRGRLEIPLCPGERYIPGQPLLRSNTGPGVVDDTDEVPDASRLTPPRIDQLHPDAAYVSLAGRMDADGLVADSVKSPSHRIITRTEEGNLEVILAPLDAVPDCSFRLNWRVRRRAGVTPRGWICGEATERYALLELQAPALNKTGPAAPMDFFFLVDRSGSMAGEKWRNACRALQQCVSQMSPEDRVSLTLFASDYQDFAERPLSAEALRADPRFSQLVDLGTNGGTELGPALEHALAGIERHSGERRAALLLVTDAQVGNDEAILELARRAPSLPIHCFGIDTALNDALLRSLALEHGGRFYSWLPEEDPTEILTDVVRVLRHPMLLELACDGDWELAEARWPSLYAGQTLYLPLRSTCGGDRISLRAKDPAGQPVTFGFAPRPIADQAPRRLWARQRLARLIAEKRDAEAIALSKAENLLCRLTSFVVWDESERVLRANRGLVQPALRQRGMGLCYMIPPEDLQYACIARLPAMDADSADNLAAPSPPSTAAESSALKKYEETIRKIARYHRRLQEIHTLKLQFETMMAETEKLQAEFPLDEARRQILDSRLEALCQAHRSLESLLEPEREHRPNDRQGGTLLGNRMRALHTATLLTELSWRLWMLAWLLAWADCDRADFEQAAQSWLQASPNPTETARRTERLKALLHIFKRWSDELNALELRQPRLREAWSQRPPDRSPSFHDSAPIPPPPPRDPLEDETRSFLDRMNALRAEVRKRTRQWEGEWRIDIPTPAS